MDAAGCGYVLEVRGVKPGGAVDAGLPANRGLSPNPAEGPLVLSLLPGAVVHLHPPFAVVLLPAPGTLALVALTYL